MDLSLDEIIKQKKISVLSSKRSFQSFPLKKKLIGLRKNRIVDARNKIIQKKRAKIRDARDKLGKKDARLKIRHRLNDLNKRSGLKTNYIQKRNETITNVQNNLSAGNLYGAPRGYIDYDNMEMFEEDYEQSNISLRRTVYNDIVPNFGLYSDKSSIKAWQGDPFESFEIPASRSQNVLDNMNIRRKIRNLSPEVISNKNMLRTNSPDFNARFNPEKSQLSYEMRSRLERAPDPHASMGIFANPSKSQILPSSYRIVVSNLHSSVSQNDIQELFEDIGELHEARLVKTGVAEVIFKNLIDAEKAVDTYHNRQLDGQPMKCLLVNPRASNKPTAPALKVSASSQSSGKTPLEIDIDALHKVLFRRK